MTERPHRVVILAVPPVVPFDLSIPAQIFTGVRQATGRDVYEFTTITPGGGEVPTSAGYGITPQGGLERLAGAETVIVAGTTHPRLHAEGFLEPETADALRSVAGRARIVSLCTGSFVLAAAGLLRGRRVATHWFYAETFRRHFPEADLDVDSLFIEDDGLFTSAGGAAAIDLCLHLVRHDLGTAVANRVARLTVVAALRDGGQRQFIERPLPEPTGRSTAAARGRMLEDLTAEHPLDALARCSHMSLRTFTRHFRAETGLSPVQWLARARLDRARHLLEESDLPVDEVADRAGFGTGANLRKHLAAAVGLSPAQYRRGYRSGQQPQSIA